jgi:hypothetical protein
VQLSLSICLGWPRRDLGRDAAWLLTTHQPRPSLAGVENFLPGAFTLIANHYQRPGLWIGWAGAMLAEALHVRRGAAPPIRIVVTDTQYMPWRGRRLRVPASRWFLRRVAALWGMIPMPADPADVNGRSATIRRVLRHLRHGDPILLFPEGEQGRAGPLREALPGTGSLLALAARIAPVIPVAFWEEGDQLRGQVGLPITLPGVADAPNRAALMSAIARLLPPQHPQ